MPNLLQFGPHMLWAAALCSVWSGAHSFMLLQSTAHRTGGQLPKVSPEQLHPCTLNSFSYQEEDSLHGSLRVQNVGHSSCYTKLFHQVNLILKRCITLHYIPVHDRTRQTNNCSSVRVMQWKVKYFLDMHASLPGTSFANTNFHPCTLIISYLHADFFE